VLLPPFGAALAAITAVASVVASDASDQASGLAAAVVAGIPPRIPLHKHRSRRHGARVPHLVPDWTTFGTTADGMLATGTAEIQSRDQGTVATSIVGGRYMKESKATSPAAPGTALVVQPRQRERRRLGKQNGKTAILHPDPEPEQIQAGRIHAGDQVWAGDHLAQCGELLSRRQQRVLHLPGPSRNVQWWIATRVRPAMSSEVRFAPMDAARSSRRVTMESRLIAQIPMMVDSMVREAT
jgi:hypothetical protein